MCAKSWNFTALFPQHSLSLECFSVTFIILVQFLHSANITSLWGEVETVKCAQLHHLL